MYFILHIILAYVLTELSNSMTIFVFHLFPYIDFIMCLFPVCLNCLCLMFALPDIFLSHVTWKVKTIFIKCLLQIKMIDYNFT